jgi:hypothetical protein
MADQITALEIRVASLEQALSILGGELSQDGILTLSLKRYREAYGWPRGAELRRKTVTADCRCFEAGMGDGHLPQCHVARAEGRAG